ncbi:hypothetical protein IF2G_08784 [Cordyceps javanica]|nr:hypothetical protein IF2G_08784 [Cordyceps javanica]
MKSAGESRTAVGARGRGAVSKCTRLRPESASASQIKAVVKQNGAPDLRFPHDSYRQLSSWRRIFFISIHKQSSYWEVCLASPTAAQCSLLIFDIQFLAVSIRPDMTSYGDSRRAGTKTRWRNKRRKT